MNLVVRGMELHQEILKQEKPSGDISKNMVIWKGCERVMGFSRGSSVFRSVFLERSLFSGFGFGVCRSFDGFDLLSF